MIKLQYKHLKDVAEFMQEDLSSKGKKSRHRMRIVNAIAEQNKKVADEEIALLKEYAKTDDDGEIIQTDKGFDIGDVKGFKRQQEELYNEYFIIDDANLETALKTVEKLVFDYDKELNGHKAFVHDYICQQFEEQEELEQEITKEDE